jgi:hypothetical protein
MKLDLLTNATVVDDAIRLVEHSNDKLTSNKEESKGADYNCKGRELEEDQAEQTGNTVTNQVF